MRFFLGTAESAEGTEEENKEVGFLFFYALSAVKNSFPNSK
jgi:hypothetical protein